MINNKTDILAYLNTLKDELNCENDVEGVEERIKTIDEVIGFLLEKDDIKDKESILLSLSCYGCPIQNRCTADFDVKVERCQQRYDDAEMFYSNVLLEQN